MNWRNIKITSLLICVICNAFSLPAFTQLRFWEASVAPGAVFNFPAALKIHQDVGLINLRARYRTDPFSVPFYYDLRVSTWKGNKGFAAKFTHHKLILKNREEQIQLFSITNGFNLFTINRLYFSKGFIWSFGAGIVVTHPESTIRQQPFPENRGMLGSGYFVSGPTAELALSGKHILRHNLYVFGEARLTGSYVQVPVVHGYAGLMNVAFHFQPGVGYQFRGGRHKP